MDVVEGGNLFVLIDKRRGDLTVDDLLEDGFFGHGRGSVEELLLVVVPGEAAVEGLDLVDEFTHVLELAVDGGVADVGDMVDALKTNPAWVYEELMSDASTHEDCDNWIKADVVRQTAARVTALM